MNGIQKVSPVSTSKAFVALRRPRHDVLLNYTLNNAGSQNAARGDKVDANILGPLVPCPGKVVAAFAPSSLQKKLRSRWLQLL